MDKVDEVLLRTDTDTLIRLVMKLSEGILSKKRLRERVIEHQRRAEMRQDHEHAARMGQR